MTAQILLVAPETPRRRQHEIALRAAFREGSQVVDAGDSQEALRRAAESRFDLVVADFVLPKPGLSGADTLTRVGELLPGVPTILYSDHGYVGELLEGFGDAFLSSEGDPAAFHRRLVRTVLELLEDAPTAVERFPKPEEEVSTVELPRAPVARRAPRLVAGKYRLVSEVGRGGMGVVYRAEDTFIGRGVALKLLHVRAPRQSDELERRMRREMTIAGQLDHPNIVTVYDAGFDGDEIYLVMELVEGQTLREEIRAGGPLGRAQTIDVLLQVLDAVGYAHAQGVIHRDLKLDNLLRASKGRIKVVDFGLAKLMSFASSQRLKAPDSEILYPTTEGTILGTPAYMAPEQFMSRKVDHRVDIYALGVVFFELLVGSSFAGLVPPIRRAEALEAGRDVKVPAIDGEQELTRICRRAVAIRPEDRYPSAEAFADALEALGTGPGWQRFLPWTWGR